jgi:hypothetical protein
MPLSEQEQRLLEEMERSLYHNDADFVATVAPRRGKPNYTVLVVGILVGVLGIATLVAGVVIRQPLVGVLGFAVMFAGVLIAVAPPRSNGSIPKPPAEPRRNGSGGQKTSGSGTSSSFMQNMNDRWEKRQDNRDQ